jgi:hypothetical protein
MMLERHGVAVAGDDGDGHIDNAVHKRIKRF